MKVWKGGRQLCGAFSLTGRLCAYRVHMLPKDVAHEGLAAASGQLELGDRVLSVNGQLTSGHLSTSALLKASVGTLVCLIERRSHDELDGGGSCASCGVPPSTTFEVRISKPLQTSKLGLVLTSPTPDSGVPVVAALGSSNSADTRAARPHSSNYECMHACHCGRAVMKRSDPFSLPDALAFFDAECCSELPHLVLPMRHAVPSALAEGSDDAPTTDGAAASVGSNKAAVDTVSTADAANGAGAADPASGAMPVGVSAAEHDDLPLSSAGERDRAAAAELRAANAAEEERTRVLANETSARLTLLGPAELYRRARGIQQACRQWHPMATVGRCWPLMATHGRRWPLMAADGRSWPLMAADGR